MPIAALLLILAQQETTVAQPQEDRDGTQRWSILVDPCATQRTAQDDDIVVCGTEVTSARLPLPAERGPPDHPAASNPELSGRGALAATSAPCATRSEGCTTGVDIFGGATFLVRAIGKLVDSESCCETPGEANPFKLVGDMGSAVGKVFRKKPDKSNRVPIPLDDPADETTDNSPTVVGPTP